MITLGLVGTVTRSPDWKLPQSAKECQTAFLAGSETSSVALPPSPLSRTARRLLNSDRRRGQAVPLVWVKRRRRRLTKSHRTRAFLGFRHLSGFPLTTVRLRALITDPARHSSQWKWPSPRKCGTRVASASPWSEENENRVINTEWMRGQENGLIVLQGYF